MDNIVIALIAGIIGQLIYRSALPLLKNIEKKKIQNLGEERSILGITKTENQLLLEKIQLSFDSINLHDIYYFNVEITSGRYYNGIEVMVVFKDILNYQKDAFLEQVKEFCSSQEWYIFTKVYIEVDDGNGVVIIRG